MSHLKTYANTDIEKKLPAWYWFVIILCVVLLVYFYLQSQSTRNTELKQISNGITQLKDLDSKVNDALIQVNFQVVNHYDFLVNAMDTLSKSSEDFFNRTEILKQPDLKPLWMQYQRAIHLKAESLELYKSHSALLKNSLNYFFLVTQQLIHKPDSAFLKKHYADLLDFINETHRISILQFFKSKQTADNINKLSDILKTHADFEQLSPLIHSMITHSDLIAQLQLDVVESFNNTLKPEPQNILDQIFHSYLLLYEQDEQATANYKTAMLVISIFLALAILISFYRQNRILVKLADTVDDLNFQHFALNQHAIVSETDVKGNITYVNQKFCDISGYSRDELIGKNHRLIKSSEHGKAFYKNIWKTIASGHVWHGEIMNCTKDGSPYWLNETIVPFVDNNGTPFKYTSIQTDITQQKANEALLEEKNQFLDHLTNTIGEGVYALDTEGRCIFVNKAAQELLGYSASEFLGQSIHDLIHFQDEHGKPIPASQCKSLSCINKGLSYIDDNQFFTRKDGSLFPVRIHSNRFLQDGKVSGSVTVFQDITVQKQTEKALQLSRQEAEAHSKQKTEFLANMSHELRTPMNAIIGLSYLVLETELTKQQRNYLEKIQTSSQILLDLINDVLDLSKIEAGKVDIEQTSFNIQGIINKLYDITHEKAEHKGLQLHCHIDPDIPDQLIGDPLRITQVLSNLIYNAIKFTEQGSVTININQTGSVETATDKTAILFEVIDTGIGLSPEEQQNIFAAFTQADTSTTRQYGGTGLGLSITRQLINLMHGELAVDSRKGQGSRFYFTLKFDIPPSIEETTFSLPHPEQTDKQEQDKKDDARKTDTADFKQARILLVEDNKVNQMVAKALLKRFNLDVCIAQNGQEAIEQFENAAKEKPFQLILMDIQMPVMDGLEATQTIRKDSEHGGETIPIIALTAHAFEEEKQRCFNAGMNDHLSKPIKPELLEKTLSRWLKP